MFVHFLDSDGGGVIKYPLNKQAAYAVVFRPWFVC